MTISKISILMVLSLVLTLNIGFCLSSAETITVVAGKIYDSSFKDAVSDASVSVTCSHNGNSATLTTNSLSGGSFVVGFELSQCQKGDSVDITATKEGYTDLQIADVTIQINAKDQETTPVSSGGSSKKYSKTNTTTINNYYLCGNGICDSGESNVTCPQDCIEDVVEIPTITMNSSKVNNENSNETNTPENNNPGITGAVIGGGIKNYIVPMGFVLIVLFLGISAFLVRRKRLG
jgi:hypothetical protein